MKDRKKRNLMIIFLFSSLLVMGIGFSIFSSTISISSISNVNSSWQIEMDIVFKDSSFNVSYENPIMGSDKISASLNNTFNSPGDYITYTVTVYNKGKISAKITELTFTGDSTNYNITNTITEDTVVSSNSSTSFELTISLKDSITSLPTTSTTHTISISVIQYDSSGLINYNNDYVSIVNSNFSIDDFGIEDEDKTSTLEVKIGDEHFYVIGYNNNNVKLLSKYNLKVGSIGYEDEYCSDYCYDDCYTYYYCSGYDEDVDLDEDQELCEEYGYEWIEDESCEEVCDETCDTEYSYELIDEEEDGYNLQSSSATGYYDHYGLVTFSNNNYWPSIYGSIYPIYVYDDNSNIKQYVDKYKSLLEGKYGVVVADARLSKKEEIIYISDSDGENGPSWLYNTGFWTGTAVSSTNILGIDECENFWDTGYSTIGYYGVRPLIEISKDYFK